MIEKSVNALNDTSSAPDDSTRVEDFMKLVPVRFDKSSTGSSRSASEVTSKSSDDLVKFEFKITGMTCVACSGSIENLMKMEFESKKMKEC